MRRDGRTAALGAAMLLWAPAAPPASPEADLVLRGGAVYTMDLARSWARAVVVKAGRIAYVGTEEGAAPWLGPRTRVIELRGAMVLPGFQDAHVHPVSGGIELGQCNLNDLATAEAILEKVRSCARETPGRDWIVGGGWALPAFPDGAPRRQALDAIAPARPVYLSAADGHSAWVSSEALRRAGITAATPDPEGGRIEREPGTGAPSGTLREAAMDMAGRLLPKPGLKERVDGLRRALELLNRHGVTAVQEASASRAELEAYRQAEGQRVLTVRVTAALRTDPGQGPEQVDGLVRLRQEFASPRLRPVAAKLFEDGVIEARTAAMLEPYLDRPAYAGVPNFAPERLNPLVSRLVRADFNVHVHAIGDRAVRLTLDALEAAGPAPGVRRPRHQIAHLEVIHPDDVPRFRALEVVANFQPLWAWADPYITDLTWPALGPERSRWIYPMASVQRAGGVLAFGSDWSVSSLNPLEGIQVAVTRQGLSGPASAPMQPEQSLDLPTALAAYTAGSAYAAGLEEDTGSLEAGKAADLVVLSANLFDVPPREIARVKVLLTLLEGQPVYSDPAWGR